MLRLCPDLPPSLQSRACAGNRPVRACRDFESAAQMAGLIIAVSMPIQPLSGTLIADASGCRTASSVTGSCECVASC